MITKYSVSRDDNIYQAWPDVVLTRSGKLVCIFSECTHHGDRSYTRIMLADSSDRGRTWTPKRPLTEGTSKEMGFFYNCARLSVLRDGRLVALVDRVPHGHVLDDPERTNTAVNVLYFSSDEGQTWSPAVETPARGIVPDKLLELSTGRWLLPCHHKSPVTGKLIQRLWYSDDQGKTWQGPVIVGRNEDLNLCEVSILPLETETGRRLVAFHRENSAKGWDCYKTLSNDDGLTWSEPIRFPLPACHRPVSGQLQDGRIMVTFRFMQGGKGWVGTWTQNFFAAVTDAASALAMRREDAWTRILPIDFDRSPKSDLGYSGWVQFPDGELYTVNYIVDDAPKGQIRGYSFRPEDFGFPAQG